MPLPSGLPFHALAPNKMSPKGDIPSLAASRHLRLRLAQIVLNHSLMVAKLLGIDIAEQPDVYIGELALQDALVDDGPVARMHQTSIQDRL